MINTTEILDQACLETVAKMKVKNSNEDQIYDHIKKSIMLAYCNDYFDGFTRQNGARERLIEIGGEVIYFELLKHIFKIDAYHFLKEHAVPLKGNDTLDNPNISEPNALYLLRDQVHKEGFESLDVVFGKNPQLLKLLISSFVNERYNNADKVKRDQLDSACDELPKDRFPQHLIEIQCFDSCIEVALEANQKNEMTK